MISLRRVGWVSIGNVVWRLGAVSISWIAARTLQSPEFALFAYFYVFVVSFQTATSFGANVVILRLIGLRNAAAEDDPQGAQDGAMVALGAFSGFAGCAVLLLLLGAGVVAAPAVFAEHGEYFLPLALIGGGFVVLAILIDLQYAVILGGGDARGAGEMMIVNGALQLLFASFAFFKRDVLVIASAMLAGEFVCLLLATLREKKRHSALYQIVVAWLRRSRDSAGDFLRALRLTLPVAGANLMAMPVTYVAIQILLVRGMSPLQVGFFSIVNNWMGMLLFVPAMLNTSMIPMLAGAFHKRSITTEKAVRLMLSRSALVLLPMCVIVAAGAPLIAAAYHYRVPALTGGLRCAAAAAFFGGLQLSVSGIQIAAGRTLKHFYSGAIWAAGVLCAVAVLGSAGSDVITLVLSITFGHVLRLFLTLFQIREIGKSLQSTPAHS
jgi:O-antigen/teichoic acid export membrane protein